MDFRLLALQTVDRKIDRNVRALSVFGKYTLEALDKELSACTPGPALDALVHVAAACSVEMHAHPHADDMVARWFSRYGEHHRTAFRDAWWFHPQSRQGDAARIARTAALLASDSETMQTLGAELAGRCGIAASVPRITALAAELPDGPLLRACELALCRLNHPPSDLPARIHRRGTGDTDALLHALRLVAASGRLELIPTAGYLQCTRMQHPALQRLAWCLATLSDPAQAHRLALEDTSLDDGMRWRVLALAGFPEGLVHLGRSVLQQTSEPTPAQLDALWTFLGEVPAEVRDKTASLEMREQALRLSVLQALRNAHVGVTNQAKHAEWTPEAMLAATDPAQSRRLRFGSAIRRREDGGAALAPAVLQLATLMRQALYIEQSVQSGRSVGAGLSAYAPSRHQVQVIGLSAWIAEAQTAEPAA
ncbi:hypothetical protein [Paracidovorax oryzae]|uniref:hypothetical protein n=1 Tax=Paracidovorax oryzae TaxID=862720 RepID=UPI001ED934A5|nr:hypothetical protein [Paracidovorax oryzae]